MFPFVVSESATASGSVTAFELVSVLCFDNVCFNNVYFNDAYFNYYLFRHIVLLKKIRSYYSYEDLNL